MSTLTDALIDLRGRLHVGTEHIGTNIDAATAQEAYSLFASQCLDSISTARAALANHDPALDPFRSLAKVLFRIEVHLRPVAAGQPLRIHRLTNPARTPDPKLYLTDQERKSFIDLEDFRAGREVVDHCVASFAAAVSQCAGELNELTDTACGLASLPPVPKAELQAAAVQAITNVAVGVTVNVHPPDLSPFVEQLRPAMNPPPLATIIPTKAPLPYKALAEMYGTPGEATRKVLDRWRKRHAGGDGYMQNPDRRPNEPEFLFYHDHVAHVMDDLKRRTTTREIRRTKTSSERPTR